MTPWRGGGELRVFHGVPWRNSKKGPKMTRKTIYTKRWNPFFSRLLGGGGGWKYETWHRIHKKFRWGGLGYWTVHNSTIAEFFWTSEIKVHICTHPRGHRTSRAIFLQWILFPVRSFHFSFPVDCIVSPKWFSTWHVACGSHAIYFYNSPRPQRWFGSGAVRQDPTPVPICMIGSEEMALWSLSCTPPQFRCIFLQNIIKCAISSFKCLF